MSTSKVLLDLQALLVAVAEAMSKLILRQVQV